MSVSGPWKTRKGTGGTWDVLGPDHGIAGPHIIARANSEQDARSIAGLPELVAAIEGSLAAIEQGEGEFASLYLSAALKKLEGGEA